VKKDGGGNWLISTRRPLETTVPTSPPQSPPTTKPSPVNAAANSGTDGSDVGEAQFTGTGFDAEKKGLYALENADLFNLLCIPPFSFTTDITSGLVSTSAAYCEQRRAVLLLDPPSSWTSKNTAKSQFPTTFSNLSDHAAMFFPRVRKANPLHDNQIEDFVPCGAIAGVFARTDAQRGVWKAPAGQDATLTGVIDLSVPLTDNENGELNPLGLNCLRGFPIIGRVVWGSRTLRGADQLASEWKYIPVRRTALYIEESLYRGTKWVVFEPNDEPLWAQIRLNVGAFMHDLFRQGAFQGNTPRLAYLVKCDSETTTQNDIDQGIVNILVGFAPLKPAEFVIIKIQQLAGQIQV
jgi:Bacteriophage tail sheath protein